MHRTEVTVLQGRLAEQTDCHRLAEHSTATSIIDAIKTADADGVIRLAIAVGHPDGPWLFAAQGSPADRDRHARVGAAPQKFTRGSVRRIERRAGAVVCGGVCEHSSTIAFDITLPEQRNNLIR